MHSRKHAAGSQHNKGKYNRKHARLGNTEEKMHGWGNTDGRTRGWKNTPQTAQHEKCRMAHGMETHGPRPARSHNRVGGRRLFRLPSSHTTVRAVRHTAISRQCTMHGGVGVAIFGRPFVDKRSDRPLRSALLAIRQPP